MATNFTHYVLWFDFSANHLKWIILHRLYHNTKFFKIIFWRQLNYNWGLEQVTTFLISWKLPMALIGYTVCLSLNFNGKQGQPILVQSKFVYDNIMM